MEQLEIQYVQPAERTPKRLQCALNVNGSKLEDRNDICNAFNDYFAILGDKLVKKLPSSGTNAFKNYLS